MTTLQTLSTRSTDSASVNLQRAQRSSFGAGDAPGFAGVLDAFSAGDAEDGIERVDESESEVGDENSEKIGADESDESSGGDAQGADGVTGAGEGVGDDRSQRINTAADLAQLLNNAAAIDLAGLANGQLGGQTQGKAVAQQVDEEPKSDAKANRTNRQPTETIAPSDFERFVGRGQSLALQNALQGAESVVAKGEGGAVAQTNPQDQGDLRRANVQAAADAQQSIQQITQQSTQTAKVQLAQVVQSQAADLNPNSRRLEGVRGINEIAAAKQGQAVTGSESNGKAGADQGGLDLGNRSQNTARLMDSKPSDDRAMQRQQIIAQVQRGLASIMNTKGGTMKLRLSPENLGEVNIKLSTKDGHVRVAIEAKNDETRSMLKEGLDGLRSAMESRGVQVDDLRVDGRVESGFERFMSDSGPDDSRDHRDQQDDPGASRDGGDGGDAGDDVGVDDGFGMKDTPQGIWTDLGLDAIA